GHRLAAGGDGRRRRAHRRKRSRRRRDALATTPSSARVERRADSESSVVHAAVTGGPDAGVADSWPDTHLSLGGEVAVLFSLGRSHRPECLPSDVAFRSTTVYVMGSAVAVAFVGSRLLRQHRAPLT